MQPLQGFFRTAMCALAACVCSAPAGGGALDDLATVKAATTRRSSSFDRSGGNSDNVVSFAPGSTHVMLDADGPGRINHIWVTVSSFPGHGTFLRDLVIRMFWERCTVPSVEVPLGDFFALGHGRDYRVASIPVCVGHNTKALNCYWPMPFRRHARIEIYNNGLRGIRRIYYNIDYDTGPVDESQALFHALYRRERALPGQDSAHPDPNDNYVILETTGRGQYVGCVLSVDADARGWWGEGDDMMYVDRRDAPTMIGTGSEDYFCNAWGFSEVFSYPYYGVPFMEALGSGRKLTTAYRWHIADPVRFQEYLKVTIEHIYPADITNDYTSVAFWYQHEPMARREPLPEGAANHPAFDSPPPNAGGKYTLNGTELETALRRLGHAVQSTTTSLSVTSRGGYLRLGPAAGPLPIPCPVDEAGEYEVKVKPYFPADGPPQFRIGLAADALHAVAASDAARRSPPVSLGRAASESGVVTFYIEAEKPIGLDYIELRRIDAKP